MICRFGCDGIHIFQKRIVQKYENVYRKYIHDIFEWAMAIHCILKQRRHWYWNNKYWNTEIKEEFVVNRMFF